MLAFGAVEYLKRTLPNGVRILVSEMPETRSASLAVFVGADRVTLGRVTPGRLRGALRRAITSSGTRSAPPSPPAPES